MKKLPKILIIIFFSIFILQMVCLIFLLAIPKKSQAATANFTPQVSIDSTFQKGVTTTPSIAKYIQSIYNYAIGIVGILAAIVLMLGGVIWLTAGGSPDKVNEAKAWIGASLSGLVLALCSYMILNTINPDLVSFKEIAMPTVEQTPKFVCCEYKTTEGITKAKAATEKECSDLKGTAFPDKDLNGTRDKCIEKVIVIQDKCCQAMLNVARWWDTIHCTDIKENEECTKEIFNVVNKDNLYEIKNFGIGYECNHEQGKCEPKRSSVYRGLN